MKYGCVSCGFHHTHTHTHTHKSPSVFMLDQGRRQGVRLGVAKCLECCASPEKVTGWGGGGGGGGEDSDTFFLELKKLWQNFHNGVGVLSSSTYMTDLWANKLPCPPWHRPCARRDSGTRYTNTFSKFIIIKKIAWQNHHYNTCNISFIHSLIQWNLVIKRSDITKPSYNKVILLVPALYISLVFLPWYSEKPDITR